LILAATSVRRVFVDSRSFAAGAPALAHVCMFCWRLRQKTSACRCRCVAACFGRCRALPSAAPRGHGAHCPRLFSAAAQRQTTKFCWSPATGEYLGLAFLAVARDQAVTTEVHNFTFSPAAVSAGFPCSAAVFEVNSEPHTGARPSVRLCVWLITGRRRRRRFVLQAQAALRRLKHALAG
jgi:hypothetical protein